MRKFGKQADERTKKARISGHVAMHTLMPGAGPVANSYVGPPPTPMEQSQQVQRDEQHQFADWQKLRTQQENSRLGLRTGEHQPPDRETDEQVGGAGRSTGKAPKRPAQKAPVQNARPEQVAQPRKRDPGRPGR